MGILYKGVFYNDCGRLDDSILGCTCTRCGASYATIHPYKSLNNSYICNGCVKEIQIGEHYIKELGKDEVLKRFEN